MLIEGLTVSSKFWDCHDAHCIVFQSRNTISKKLSLVCNFMQYPVFSCSMIIQQNGSFNTLLVLMLLPWWHLYIFFRFKTSIFIIYFLVQLFFNSTFFVKISCLSQSLTYTVEDFLFLINRMCNPIPLLRQKSKTYTKEHSSKREFKTPNKLEI